MERMGDILARTATRNARLRGAAAARLTKNKSRVAAAEQQVETPPAHPQLARPSLKQASNQQTPQSVPARPAQPAQPDALERVDALHNDQILELPTRSNNAKNHASAALTQRNVATHQLSVPRQPAAAQTTPKRHIQSDVAQETVIPAAMTPLRDVAQSFLARRAARVAANEEQEPASEATTPAKAKARKPSSEPAVCPHCGGAGYLRLEVPVDDPAFGKPVPCQCREREWEERRRLDLRRFSSLDPFRDKTFTTFDQKVPGLREVYDAARHYADDPQGWLVLRGGYGCGKTHLAAAIANAHLAAGAHVFFSIVPDLLDHLRAAFAPTSEMRYDEMFERVREAGLLVLDDLGAENSTAWATEKLFQIINYRYNFRMPTVITTNNRLLSHMDERIASRLSDIGLVQTIVIEAQDYRKRHAAGAPRAAQSNQRGRTQAE